MFDISSEAEDLLTRRSAIQRLAGFIGLGLVSHGAWCSEDDTAEARMRERRLNMPALACDCHSHIIGPDATFPMIAGRAYTPPPASVRQLSAMHRALGITRSVLIQPSFYGSDNSCLLAALDELGSSARGVAVVPDNAPEQQLDDLHASGIRGIRINGARGSKDLTRLSAVIEAAGRRAARYGWHVQLFLPMPVIAHIAPAIEASSVPFVLDHFAGAQASGVGQPGFDAVLRLLKRGHAYLKLTAPYHVSQPPDYNGMAELATAFVDANPERVLWGTDWPHTQWVPDRIDTVTPFFPADNIHLLELLFKWVPNQSLRDGILVDNPARLFGFS